MINHESNVFSILVLVGHEMMIMIYFFKTQRMPCFTPLFCGVVVYNSGRTGPFMQKHGSHTLNFFGENKFKFLGVFIKLTLINLIDTNITKTKLLS